MPKGVYKRSKETRQKMSEYQKNRKRKTHSEETKQKIRDKHTGRRLSPKSEFQKGHSRSKLDKHPNWKGGRTKDVHGYIWVRVSNHPNSRNGYFREHRLIIEKSICRYLKEEEVVHHINSIRDDNRLENLKLFATDSLHHKLCHAGKKK